MSKMFDSPKKLKFVHTKFPILKERTKQGNFKKKKKELLSCFFLYDFQLEWTKLCIYKFSQFHDFASLQKLINVQCILITLITVFV